MQVDLLVFTLLVIIDKITVAKDSINDLVIPRNCTEVYSINTTRYEPYQETYREKKWFRYRWRTRTNYRLKNHISHKTRPVCCPGYTSWGTTNHCIPVCNRGCMPNARCTQPDTCRCNEGYGLASTNECIPICLDECINADCIGNNVCVCHEGFHMLPDLTTCVPYCDPYCNNFEYCVEPHVCRCINGYKRRAHSIDRVDSSGYNDKPCRAVCEQECVNSDCVEPNLCHCHKGYEAEDEDSFTCRPICRGGCRNADCVGPEDCRCHEAYRKPANDSQSHVCQPICTEGCVNAECIAPDTCSCLEGYAPVGGEPSHICQPYCSSTCEHGKCTAPEVCTCGDGYEPKDNGTRCAPICSHECEMGNCTSPEYCTCFEGYGLAEGSVYICAPVCSKECINGLCTAPDECACHDGYEKKNSNSTEAEYKCIIICGCEYGFCSEESPICERCFEGYELDPDSGACKPRCEGDCPNGRCVQPQVCECNENYIVEKNGTQGKPVSCVEACGGECVHGACEQVSQACSCLDGWTGQFCDEPTLCTIAVSDMDNNNTLQTHLNESQSASNETGEEMIKDIVGSTPTCNDRCLQQLNNLTKCVTQYDQVLTVLKMTCFISIDSPCNALAVVESKQNRFHDFQENVRIVTFLTATTLLFVILIIGITFFIKKRRTAKLIVTLKSIEQVKNNEEHNLIESDSISL